MGRSWEQPEEWRKLHNDELQDLCCSSNIIRVTTWRRMRWAKLTGRRGEKKNPHMILVEKPEGKRPLEKDVEVDEILLLKWI